MNKIQKMIHDLCPNGVEWKTLGEVARLSRGKVISKEYLRDNHGDYPVYSSQTANDGELGRINTYSYDGKYLTWTTDGAYAGTIFRRIGKFNITNVCGLIDIVDPKLNIDFAYYWLSRTAKSYVYDGMGNPKLMTNVMGTISIPIPPLAVQAEIVNLLDKFTQLSAELKAELKLRRKQYDYYRNHLLSFDSNSTTVQWMPLGEVGTFAKGHGILKSDFVETGFPCIHYGQVHTIYNTFTYTNKSFISEELAAKCRKAHKGDLIIASTSEDVEACCKAVAWMGDYEVAVSGDAHIFSHNQNPKYMAYLFQTEMFQKQKRPYAVGAKVVRVKSESMEKFVFPFPSLAEQERIVGILDKFETLVNDLSKGLPAEIALVQKQYEYYRNMLLTFE